MPKTLGTLIVTGGGRGIGAAVCRLAGREGYSVAVNYHSQEAAAGAIVEEIRQMGGRSAAIHADIGKEPDVVRLFEEAEGQLGPLAALVNNAGITGGFSRVEAVEAAMLERLFAVNIYRRHALRAGGGEAALHGSRRTRRRDRQYILARGETRLRRRVGPLCDEQGRD